MLQLLLPSTEVQHLRQLRRLAVLLLQLLLAAVLCVCGQHQPARQLLLQPLSGWLLQLLECCHPHPTCSAHLSQLLLLLLLLQALLWLHLLLLLQALLLVLHLLLLLLLLSIPGAKAETAGWLAAWPGAAAASCLAWQQAACACPCASWHAAHLCRPQLWPAPESRHLLQAPALLSANCCAAAAAAAAACCARWNPARCPVSCADYELSLQTPAAACTAVTPAVAPAAADDEAPAAAQAGHQLSPPAGWQYMQTLDHDRKTLVTNPPTTS
jgi:hypothetical protein